MIKIKKIEFQTCEVFNPNNVSLGFVNYFQFNDLRIQIMEQKVSGYYIMFENIKHEINADGKIYSHPIGLFSLIDEQLDKLLKL